MNTQEIDEIELQFMEGKFDIEYAKYIDSHADASVINICNGDSLTKAMELGYLYNDFISYIRNL